MSVTPNNLMNLHRFDQICEYMASNGVDKMTNTKLKEYRRFLEAVRDDRIEQEGFFPIIWREYHEFAFVFGFFIDNRLVLPRSIVKKVMKGRVMELDDTHSDPSKNYMLELRASAYLIKQGFNIILNEQCDVVARRGHRIYFIECKRLYSEARVSARLKEASKQLASRFNDPRFSKHRKEGLIWVDPSAIINPGRYIFPCRSRSAAKQAARAENIDLLQSVLSKYDHTAEKQVSHLVSQLVVPAWFQKELMVATLFSSLVVPIRRQSIYALWQARKLFHGLFDVDELVFPS